MEMMTTLEARGAGVAVGSGVGVGVGVGVWVDGDVGDAGD
jgi:hypothetical protein